MAAVRTFLKKKNVIISVDRYLIKALGAMTMGLFSSLLIGLIIKVIGQQTGIEWLVELGVLAGDLMGAAIGVSVAYGLEAPPLVLFASAITGAAGAQLGGPVGAFVAAVFGAEFGKIVSKETKIDIIVTPMVTLVIGWAVAYFIGPPLNSMMKAIGAFIMWATVQQPFIMGVLVSVVMGIVLTLPISSAALAIMLDLAGPAAGAATVGCCAQMIGFAVMSFKENRWGGLLAQGLGTSMLQMPNIVRNWRIWIPPTLASAVTGPMSTCLFHMENIPEGAGMGTSGLVGQFSTITAMGTGSQVWLGIALLHFILPAVLTLFFAYFCRKWGWIKEGDLKLDI